MTAGEKKVSLNKLAGIAVVACIFAALIPYIGSLGGEFVFDDVPLVQVDPFYTQEANPLMCWKRDFWKDDRKQGLYRPVTLFTYWVNAKISGISSPAFRTTNLFFHMIVSLLVLMLVLRLNFGHWTAMFAAVLFAVHPIHSEAVIPAFGRGELLCALFLFSALIMHTYSEKHKYAPLAAGVLAVFACWSKEHGVAFFPLCVLIDVYLKRPGSFQDLKLLLKQKVPAYSVYLLAIAIFFISRYLALGSFIPSKTNFNPAIDNPIALCKFPLDIVSAMKVQGLALMKFFWPATLSHDYSFAQLLPSTSVLDWKAWLTLMLFIGIPFSVSMVFRRLRYKMIFLVLSYVVCVIPAGNFIVMAGTIFGERLQYIPSVWLCIFAGMLMTALFRKVNFKIILVGMVVIVIAASVRTYVRGIDWENGMSLAVSGASSAPNSVKTWNDLGMQLGELASTEKDPVEMAYRYNDAISALDKALSICPRFFNAYANRGIYKSVLGDFPGAEKDLRTAISIYPRNFKANYVLGAIVEAQGRQDEAEKIWTDLLKLFPDNTRLRESCAKLRSEIESKKMGNNVSTP